METLTDDQDVAMHKMADFLRSFDSEFCLQGWAGCGKTWLMQRFLGEFCRGKRIALTAPTNKASGVLKAMAEEAGVCADTMTTYSLLGLKLNANGETRRVEAAGRDKFNDYDIVVVDEASMVNRQLRKYLAEAVRKSPVKVFYMGDPLQLPPVNEESSPVFRSVENNAYLSTIVRQAEDNPILRATGEVRRCIRDVAKPRFVSESSESGGLHVLEPNRWEHWMKSGFNSHSYKEDPDSFRAVAWTNRRVNYLNRMVRAVLMPDIEPKQRYAIGERVIAASPIIDGESVSMTTDEEGVIVTMNVQPHPTMPTVGDVYALEIRTASGNTAFAVATHEDSYPQYNKVVQQLLDAAKEDRRQWSAYWEFVGMFADLRPCHALTAHRSQGSTYQNVFVDVANILQNYRRQEALQCLYVAISRAAKNVMVLDR